MGNVRKDLRVQDVDVKRLNHMGLGLRAIAEELGCHPATITTKLAAMGLEPTDTRRSFMEQVFNSLEQDQKDWLSHNLFNTGIGVREFITGLIREAWETHGKQTVMAAVPTATPEMDGAPVGEPEPIHPHADELVTGEFEVGGISEKPSPDQTVPPEVLQDAPEERPKTLPEKPKLNFG